MKKTITVITLCALIALVGCITPTPSLSGPGKELSIGDKQPVAIIRVRPIYPFDLLKAKVSGSALVEFVVNKSSDVVSANVVETSAKEFGDLSLAAIYQWKFKPGVHNGQLVNARMQLPFYFDINNTDNKLPEPTPASVTPAADAPVAPATGAAQR